MKKRSGNLQRRSVTSLVTTIRTVTTSVYEAMVRMSQDWKLRHMMIEMHGNNGSVDGDSAAAMRYTEARLSAIAGEMLRDIRKNTVDFVPKL